MENDRSKDIAVLVESFHSYQTLDPLERKEAFCALRTLLAQTRKAQDSFRELQGVELMLSIYQEGKDKEDMENAVFTLGVAVEHNDVTRNALLTPAMFKMIKGAMNRTLTSSAYLLHCLVSNSGDGQRLARTTRCIHKLCDLYKEIITKRDKDEETCKTCSAISSTLCTTMINPVNEANQELCCSLLSPSAVRCLYSETSTHFLPPLINLLGSLITGNSKTQTHLRIVGGVRALIALFKKHFSTNGTQNMSFSTQLVNTLSLAWVNHNRNQIEAVELGVIGVLLGCLQSNTDTPDVMVHTVCITAIICLLDSENDLGKQAFQDSGGVAVLIELLATRDEKLKQLVTFLLHKTFQKEGSSVQLPSSRSTVDCPTPEQPLKTVNADHLSPVNKTPEPIPVRENESVVCVNRKLPGTCTCKDTSPVDSHTVLKALLNRTCERHTAIGQQIANYIIKKKKTA